MLPLQLLQHADAKELSLQALDQVGLSQRSQHYPKQLSGGEQQRVAIARAFATKPRILFADEPTGNLDNATGKIITELLFKMNSDASTTLILVTHDMQLASRCQRQLQLDNGLLIALA
jgi:putative ABC transport system ATP-binding protein